MLLARVLLWLEKESAITAGNSKSKQGAQMPKKYNTKEAVKLMRSWGISFKPGTLEVWRCKKEGPKFLKIRNKVFYSREALEKFCQGLEVKTLDMV